MNKLYILLITILSTAISSSDIYRQKSAMDLSKSESAAASHRLSTEDIERLLDKPTCFKPILEGDRWSRIRKFPVSSKRITLSAELYLPEGEGPWPAVIIVPGGFNDTEFIMGSPRYEAPRLAQYGFAAVVYYKRGTGLSGGSYADAMYDDFLDDVGSIAKQLARHPDIDRACIGACGGSGGGFVASIAAARYPELSFVVNKSGPIVPVDEEDNFNIAYALRSRSYADSLVEQVLPLWKRHHAAWAQVDTAALRIIATRSGNSGSTMISFCCRLRATRYSRIRISSFSCPSSVQRRVIISPS